ncbi:MAG: hypothetical protein HDQ94_05690 [Desulfovibrio sp.]|nr:hypothetical protein [Desulfovibrio sp.]
MNSYKQSLYAGIIRILANVLMVGALFFAMRQAALPSSWPSEAVFCAWFFGITIPLWGAACLVTRRIRRHFPAEFESLVELPRKGPQLVRWRVLDEDGRMAPAR